MLACNLDILHFYRAKARERESEGFELARVRRRKEEIMHKAPAGL